MHGSNLGWGWTLRSSCLISRRGKSASEEYPPQLQRRALGEPGGEDRISISQVHTSCMVHRRSKAVYCCCCCCCCSRLCMWCRQLAHSSRHNSAGAPRKGYRQTFGHKLCTPETVNFVSRRIVEATKSVTVAVHRPRSEGDRLHDRIMMR